MARFFMLDKNSVLFTIGVAFVGGFVYEGAKDGIKAIIRHNKKDDFASKVNAVKQEKANSATQIG